MAQTKHSYPAQEITPETAAMWVPAWLDLARKHGIPSLLSALREHLVTSQFFPHPAKLAALLNKAAPARSRYLQVPTTKRQYAKLLGKGAASRMSEYTIEEVRRFYGAEAAQVYAETLSKEAQHGESDAI